MTSWVTDAARANGEIRMYEEGPRPRTLVAVFPQSDRESSAKANATLAAAAPDLRAVCRRLIESADYWSEYDVPLGIVDDLRAAVAKAGTP